MVTKPATMQMPEFVRVQEVVGSLLEGGGGGGGRRRAFGRRQSHSVQLQVLR